MRCAETVVTGVPCGGCVGRPGAIALSLTISGVRLQGHRLRGGHPSVGMPVSSTLVKELSKFSLLSSPPGSPHCPLSGFCSWAQHGRNGSHTTAYCSSLQNHAARCAQEYDSIYSGSAAVTWISTSMLGRAISACTVALTGLSCGSTQAFQT